MLSLHLTQARVPHPAMSMLGRSLTSDAMRGELPIASDSPVWKLHAFARGVFHWQVGEKPIRIPAGHWLLVPPGVVHGGIGSTRERGLFYWMHLHPERTWPGMIPSEHRSLMANLQGGLVPASFDFMARWEELVELAQGSHPYRRSRFQCKAGTLLHTFLDDTERERHDLPSGWRIEEVLAYIDGHLDLNIRNEQLAAMAGLGRSRFSDVFKAKTGQTPHDYVLNKRIERSKNLLSSHSRSILEISLEVGFSSSQAFATMFKRSTGMSPSQWRRRPQDAVT